MSLITSTSIRASKYIVGITWFLGIAEIIFDETPIPSSWLWVVMVISLLLHAGQAFHFIQTYGQHARPIENHILQIMIFGMAHVLTYRQILEAKNSTRDNFNDS